MTATRTELSVRWDETIKAMHARGACDAAIGTKLKLTTSAVCRRRRRLGLAAHKAEADRKSAAVRGCRHCKRGVVSRPRGLCWSCYYTPSIRERYSTSKRNDAARAGSGNTTREPQFPYLIVGERDGDNYPEGTVLGEEKDRDRGERLAARFAKRLVLYRGVRLDRFGEGVLKYWEITDEQRRQRGD